MAENELVIVHTGEVINLDDAGQCVNALAYLRNVERTIREAKQILTDAVAAEAARVGTKTFRFGSVTATLQMNRETHWDVDTLAQLRDLGLPEERYNALVREEISYVVNGSEARAIAAANPEYARIIEAAKTVVERPSYVTVKGSSA